MKRTSFNNKVEFRELEKPVDITISTKVPSKWLFVDLETGDVWIKEDGKTTFNRPRKGIITLLKKMLRITEVEKENLS